MNKQMTFVTGFLLGYFLHKKIAGLFVDKCRIPECHFRIVSSKPEDVLEGMAKHHKEKHPGWK